MVFQPAFGESLRQNSLKRLLRRGEIAGLGRANRRRDLMIRSQIDLDGLSLLPILPMGGDLQDRWPT
jgi:hypothetical protein